LEGFHQLLQPEYSHQLHLLWKTTRLSNNAKRNLSGNVNVILSSLKCVNINFRVNHGKAMHANSQIARFPTYMSSSLLPFRPFFVFPIMNIYIHNQRRSNYDNTSTVSEQNKFIKNLRTLHMALIIRHVRFSFHNWSWHGLHSRYHEKCLWYATVVTIFHGVYSVGLWSMIHERSPKFNAMAQKTWILSVHVIVSERLAQGLAVPDDDLVNTRISFVSFFCSQELSCNENYSNGAPISGPSTHSSRATCCSRHSVILLAKTFKMRKYPGR
jgi:hypothetical protein